jgi:hypothetical protein
MKEIPILTITRWVGHTSSKMIEQVYGHLSPAFTAQQMTRFNFEPPTPTKPEASA